MAAEGMELLQSHVQSTLGTAITVKVIVTDRDEKHGCHFFLAASDRVLASNTLEEQKLRAS